MTQQTHSEQSMRPEHAKHREQSMSSMKSCIEACTNCYQVCLQTAMNHCLKTGGKHVEPEHFRLMMSCAEICQTSANFQLSGSSFSNRLCAVCAEVCEACAVDCKRIGGMDECVAACERCAESCRQMASASAQH
ncbi:MAG: four-helix bundle copper-binding protein [Methylobacter sp.]